MDTATSGNGTTATVIKKRRRKLDRALITKYLTDRHCILWGFSGSIDTPQGRDAAAEWLLTVIDDITLGDG